MTEAATGAETNTNRGESVHPGGAAAVMDMLLTDSAVGPARRWLPGRSGLKAARNLALRPTAVAGRAGGLAAELGRILAGRSEVEPDGGDARFKDDAWRMNPLFRTLCQSYLAVDGTIDGLIDDADLDWQDERRLRFAARNLADALAPSNFPGTNPTVLKATIDSGGLNFVKGARQLYRDLSEPPRIPTKVDKSAFEVGGNLAVSPGSVIYECELFELIQYEPTTEEVREVPLLVVPPQINKFYIADISPGRSMFEYFVGQGERLFTISWRNPTEEHADWDLDTYVAGVIEALGVIEEITGQPKTHLLALCAGGITATLAVNHLCNIGEGKRVAGLSLGVAVLDQERGGTAGAFMDRTTAATAVAESARKGYIDGAALAGVFAWLRPNDLVWRYWVSNYLLGKTPPTFDVLYWNSDATRLSAGLHRDFVRLSLENALVEPGKAEVCGSPVDLGRIDVSSYVVAGINDHISPWADVYQTTQLLGTDPTFVLSNSGHIVAMVNPPGSDRASFQINEGGNPPDYEEWLAGSSEQEGSWWEHWVGWLGRRSGAYVPAPGKLGSKKHAPIRDAPGRYVHD
ncbi:MAG: PHA/PHB synthase family protein [Solirubrobacterales bacterium]